jgi:hypothetical protein
MVSQLSSGQTINVGAKLTSPGAKAELRLQQDGNLVLYAMPGNRAVWNTGIRQGASSLIMQPDGNLVILNTSGRPIWSVTGLGAKIIGGSMFSLQDDGNAVIYAPDKTVTWSTKTQGFQDQLNPNGNFLANAIKAAGRPISSAIHFVDHITGQIDKAISSIPFIGPALHAVCSICTEEYQIADAILKGERLDHVFLDAVHREISDYKAVAPYVQMVISNVPAIGPEISAGISAGLALASGQPITQVVIAAAEGAMPGGPMVKMVFDAARTTITGIVKGEKIGDIAAETGISALGEVVPLPPAAKALMVAGLNMAKQVASGAKLDSTMVTTAVTLLPKEAAIAFAGDAPAPRLQGGTPTIDHVKLANALIKAGQAQIPNLTPIQRKHLSAGIATGIAMGHAQNVQKKSVKQYQSSSTAAILTKVGANVTQSDPLVQAGKTLGSTEYQAGYHIGVGLMQHRIGIYAMMSIRRSLRGEQLKGLDLATSLHVGRAIVRPKKLQAVSTTPIAQLGFLTTKGMMRAQPDNKAALIMTISAHPEARDGAVSAIKDVARHRSSWWGQLKHNLGFLA